MHQSFILNLLHTNLIHTTLVNIQPQQYNSLPALLQLYCLHRHHTLLKKPQLHLISFNGNFQWWNILHYYIYITTSQQDPCTIRLKNIFFHKSVLTVHTLYLNTLNLLPTYSTIYKMISYLLLWHCSTLWLTR